MANRNGSAQSDEARTRRVGEAAARALAEAEARRAAQAERSGPREIDGRGGKEPVRYGDWEVKGRAVDF